jgi:CubicO group peptidase (beta-lactamase class C family)
VGVDWAGEMVSRVNGNITLEEYLEKNVWGPLGMKNMTFHPASTPAVLEKLMDMTVRDCGLNMFGGAENPDAKVLHTDDKVWDLKTKHCHGGAGGYGSLIEYQKLLQSLCANDGKVLKPATVDDMFKPQLTDAARASLAAIRAIPELNQAFIGMPQEVRADFGIGGMMNLDAYPGRKAGSLAWGGYPNLLWWIDRVEGMNGILGTQICPPGDAKVNAWSNAWAEEICKRAAAKGRL